MSEIPSAYVEQYSANLQMLSQQEQFNFAGKTNVEMVKGKVKFLEQIGSKSATKRTQRYQVTTPGAAMLERRALRTDTYDVTDWIDEDDGIALLIDPQSAFIKAQNAALNRTKDEVVIQNALGNAYSGENGTVANALPSGQQVAVNYTGGTPANSGLTFEKLQKARSILIANNALNDGEKAFFVIHGNQVEDLLAEAKDMNYNSNSIVEALQNGSAVPYYGFNFIISNEVEVDSSDYRKCFAYVSSGLTVGYGRDLSAKVDILPERSHAIQVLSSMNIGCVRSDDKKVVQVLCLEV
jgi:hypothetical protein